MRIALVSDIHGNLAALDAVVADMAHRATDTVVNLDDSLSGPLLPLETAQRLSALHWRHVAGNHERQVLCLSMDRQNPSDAYTSCQRAMEDKAWLASHEDPCATRLHSGEVWTQQLGRDVALCHGSPRSDIEYLLETPVGKGVRLATVARRLGLCPPHGLSHARQPLTSATVPIKNPPGKMPRLGAARGRKQSVKRPGTSKHQRCAGQAVAVHISLEHAQKVAHALRVQAQAGQIGPEQRRA